MSKRITYLSLGVLTGVTVVSGCALTSVGVDAASTTKNVSVSVGEVCGFEASAEGDRTRNVSPSAGSAAVTGDITTTVYCNKNGGFSVYAASERVNASGVAVLVDSAGSNEIATGTSGTDSWWAVCYAPIDGTFKPSIVSGYQCNSAGTSYHSVPGATPTEVVSFGGTTTDEAGATFTTSYKIYAATNQAAGTYTGQVRYTLSQN